MTLLEFDDVSITYQSRQGLVPAVRNVSLSLPLGQALGIAGESGCGKTTLADSCLLYTSPSPRDRTRSRMPSSA